MLEAKTETLVGSKRTRTLAAGLLMTGMMAVSLMAASPAYASTTFTVNSTSDAPDANTNIAACDTNVVLSGDQCTLRAAIEQANATSGTDTIDFDIPGKGVHTISPSSPLPDITDAVTLNGYSQPGSSPNTLAKGTNAKLMVELDGTNLSDSSQEALRVEASDTLIKGLVINRFLKTSAIGIFPVDSPGSVTNVRIEGNFLGTDPSGTQDRGNIGGMFVLATSNSVVGGSSPAARNLISGNQLDGIFIGGFDSVGASNNNRVEGNLIGTQRDGVSPLGNDGTGVNVNGDRITGQAILSNSIFSSSGIGIDLVGTNGPTANDTGDPDIGANQLQNKPEITSAKPITKRVKGKKKLFTSIAGNLNSNASKPFTIQLFSNPSGTTDEGKTLIGQRSVTTDASGNASFDLTVSRSKAPVGSAITATATNEATGDTSEFSVARQVG